VEVAVTVVEDEGAPRALPAVEVEAKGGVYDYTARYTAGAAHFHCPARIDAATATRLADAALAAHQLLGLRDVSRTDAVVDAAGRVQILEVNVSPGLTDTSLLPTAAVAAGLDLGRLYARLIDRAVARRFT
jgi:D-alanine-D-alanine ligase